MIPVVWLWLLDEEHNGFWDWALLQDILVRSAYKFVSKKTVTPQKFSVVVLPARQHADKVAAVNEELAKLESCLLILTGDEEASFPIELLNHPNLIVWAHHRDDTDLRIPNGYTPHTKLPPEPPEKTLNWYFGGQVTHSARKVMADHLLTRDDGALNATEGFAQGDKESYLKHMLKAKVVPCPSGPVIGETFREYEALECGAYPLKDYTELDTAIEEYPANANRAFANWQQAKRELVVMLDDTVRQLSGIDYPREEITVLIPTSPIKSHPSTAIIEETVASVRDRLPGSEIILMIDGVREEQSAYRERYDEYIRRLLWKANQWNALPLLFEEHTHQAGMTKVALEHVRTPLILFVEQDTPLCEDIPFEGLGGVITEDKLDVIRLYPEGRIEPQHAHLMKSKPRKINSQPFVKTIQWSQRPHLAKTVFYKWMIEENFVRNDGTVKKSMIEDIVHGKAHSLPEKYRIGIYHPEGHIKRSTHTDAREDDPKFDMEYQ